MRKRITAEYLLKEGFNEIGDREIDLDIYEKVEVNSVEEGRQLIKENDLYGNGIGTIIEQKETEFGWEDIAVHSVCEGVIFQTETIES